MSFVGVHVAHLVNFMFCIYCLLALIPCIVSNVTHVSGLFILHCHFGFPIFYLSRRRESVFHYDFNIENSKSTLTIISVNKLFKQL